MMTIMYSKINQKDDTVSFFTVNGIKCHKKAGIAAPHIPTHENAPQRECKQVPHRSGPTSGTHTIVI